MRAYTTGPPLAGVRLPRYLTLLHGNVTRLPEQPRTKFLQALRDDARRIGDAELDLMLGPDRRIDWRPRLTAAWLIGLDGRTSYREALAALLMESQAPYAGQGYCLALARFGAPADADFLAAYLDRFLPTDQPYDQRWALGALLHIDNRLGTAHAARFVSPGGLWHRSRFAADNPVDVARRMTKLCGIGEGLVE